LCVTCLEQFLPMSTWAIDSPLNTAWFKLWKSVHFHRPPQKLNHDLQRTGKSSGLRGLIAIGKTQYPCLGLETVAIGVANFGTQQRLVFADLNNQNPVGV
jgi:hypothetical protein